jgi:hypothetical protein
VPDAANTPSPPAKNPLRTVLFFCALALSGWLGTLGLGAVVGSSMLPATGVFSVLLCVCDKSSGLNIVFWIKLFYKMGILHGFLRLSMVNCKNCEIKLKAYGSQVSDTPALPAEQSFAKRSASLLA